MARWPSSAHSAGPASPPTPSPRTRTPRWPGPATSPGGFVWPTSSTEDPTQAVTRLLDIGARIGRPTIAIATDDAAAVLLAEHADALRPQFLLPTVAPTLPRTLANKRGLYELCLRSAVPTPRTTFPTNLTEAITHARELTYPVVAKNTEPWTPRPAQIVKSTTVLHNEQDLCDRLGATADLTGLLLQEYIPHEHSEDWFVALHACGALASAYGPIACPPDRTQSSTSIVQFTGHKARAWPPRSGVTADGRATPNPYLGEITARFVREIGWQGPADVEWRLDQRDGRYLLVDFNVRVGAQFRCGQTPDGIDVVRALHLDLTGRGVAAAPQDYRRRLVVGNLLLPTLVGERLAGLPAPRRPASGGKERAWLAADDLVPSLVMLARGARPIAGAMLDNWHEWRRRTTRAPDPQRT